MSICVLVVSLYSVDFHGMIGFVHDSSVQFGLVASFGSEVICVRMIFRSSFVVLMF